MYKEKKTETKIVLNLCDQCYTNRMIFILSNKWQKSLLMYKLIFLPKMLVFKIWSIYKYTDNWQQGHHNSKRCKEIWSLSFMNLFNIGLESLSARLLLTLSQGDKNIWNNFFDSHLLLKCILFLEDGFIIGVTLVTLLCLLSN